MSVFTSFDVLLPKAEYIEKWPVVACDQFTSQPEYWQKLDEAVGSLPSALRCILPEVELKSCSEDRYELIRSNMRQYLESGIFNTYKNTFIYVERSLLDGSVRPGIVGVIDLEEYDYNAGAISAIRATEKTVVERIPPRMKVRRGAPIELSHVLLLCDDEQRSIIEPLADKKAKLQPVYDLELMQGGGHIRAWLVEGENAAALQESIDNYCDRKRAEFGTLAPMLFAVGDGNHSLATAKACYEELKSNGADEDPLARARYAMVELENIMDDSQKFEPIHRIITNCKAMSLLTYLGESCCAENGYPIRWISGGNEGIMYLDKSKGVLPIGILQSALDEYLKNNYGEIDYIHGEDTLRELSAKPGSIGFVLESVPKDDFFRGIASDGVLPRKTFSMGEAQEKRYYIEAREI
ncbi:MAG: DUF1015 domain-containing protein [Oscillospiraceae bacterium]|nr:DUF1015 domain-containing protein [Oscillospiraceae bacterium]